MNKSLGKPVWYVFRNELNKYKVVALFYLIFRAIVPFTIAVFACIVLVGYKYENLDNVGALLVCGALLSELLYFQITPSWRSSALFLNDDFVDTKYRDNVVEYQGLRTGAKFEYNPSDSSIDTKSIRYRVVLFNTDEEIDDFAVLKLLDFTNYSVGIREKGRWKPYNPRKRVDWIVALLIAAQAVLGTILWGFGCYLTCEC